MGDMNYGNKQWNALQRTKYQMFMGLIQDIFITQLYQTNTKISLYKHDIGKSCPVLHSIYRTNYSKLS